MNNIFCKNCYYFGIKTVEDSKGRYICSFHNLYDGEVSWPEGQRCDDFLSILHWKQE
jgi:hypothetical protein